ncbi:DUF4198 domain-containing protein [Parahaliea aestuarii]|uniref:DUF4198 domain-containing protein n=1 Tax=Parahaliea aestuarii TaxID=1852021 RepID=A0A5C9A0F5_9GAMM|nr:DUF4198 domain-containing protein [Parahaliea aestuarii]TXS93260.1 DUF4198 domain-containing protein [Parahaliea aestuarii]
MKKTLAIVAAALTAASVTLPVSAHRAWILPVATVLSSDDPWVSFDAAISNDIFHPDYHAMRLDGVQAIGPDGQPVELQNSHSGKHRSNFDLNLAQPGTYKVYSASAGLSARWETADGERKFWPGRGERPDPEGFKKNVPMDGKNLQITQGSRRLETFVTAGAPSTTALKASNVGLELVPVTHPNDLYAGEAATFTFLIDGEPAVGAEVAVIPGGSRYRDAQAEIKLSSDDKGQVSIDWPQAGMYFLEAEYSDDRAEAPATSRRGTYTATFEVLPL